MEARVVLASFEINGKRRAEAELIIGNGGQLTPPFFFQNVCIYTRFSIQFRVKCYGYYKIDPHSQHKNFIRFDSHSRLTPIAGKSCSAPGGYT